MFRRLTHLPIKKRNLIGFFSLILLLITLSCVSLTSLSILSRNMQSLYNNSFTSVQHSWVVKNGFNTLEKEMYKIIVSNSTSSIFQTTADILKATQNLHALNSDRAYSNQLDMLQTYLNELKVLHQHILDASLASDFETAISILEGEYATTISKAHLIATDLTDYANTAAENKLHQTLVLKNCVLIFTVVITVISILLGLYISFVITKSIIVPLEQFKAYLFDFARGQLNLSIPYKNADEIGALGICLEDSTATLNSYIEDISKNLSHLAEGHMDITISSHYEGDFKAIEYSMLHIASSLSTVLNQIQSATYEVSDHALQVLDGSKLLADQNTHQKTLITQLFDTIQEVSNKSNENTESSLALYDMSHDMTLFIENNSEKMSLLTHTIEAIQNASFDIKKIIGVIDGIASQSHLLSLNATIEASRLGVQGNAFYIIAKEMHELSLKSSDAVKETTALIEACLDTTFKGRQIVQQTIDFLDVLITKIHMIQAPINSIAHSSKEQTYALSTMKKDINQISTITYDIADFALQSADISELLAARSQELKALLGQFTFES